MQDDQLKENQETSGVSAFPKRVGLRRGIYLLPNLITTGALFSGFYSIISAMTGHLEYAAIAIVIAGFLDSLDGRIARLTHTSAFPAAMKESCHAWVVETSEESVSCCREKPISSAVPQASASGICHSSETSMRAALRGERSTLCMGIG